MKQLMILGFSSLCMIGGGMPRRMPGKESGPGTPKQVLKEAKSTKPVKVKQDDGAARWVDSVFESLNDDERIAQLIMIRAHSNLGEDHVRKVTQDIQDNKVGGLIFFQ